MSENGVNYEIEYDTKHSEPPTFKAIVTGDWHFRGTSPRARLDNFQEALTAKILEVYDLARTHRANVIIVPGDLLDSPGVSWSTVTDLALLLTQAPCPVITIHGNHDIWAGNPASKYRTPYGFLERLGLIHDVGGGGPGSEYQVHGNRARAGCFDEKEEVWITGAGFTVDTDTDSEAGRLQYVPHPHHPGAYMPGERLGGFFIHLVHSMLLDKPPSFEGMRHTLISQVKTSAHVIISGHEHTGFGVRMSGTTGVPDGGTLFVNPGALCRLSAHEAEMKRDVGVALLTVSGEGAGKTGAAGRDRRDVDARFIPLTSARPGHEVLSRKHIESAVEREGRIEEFLQLLAAEGEAKFLEVREILEDIAAREELPDGVKMEALRRVGAAREKIGVGGGANNEQR